MEGYRFLALLSGFLLRPRITCPGMALLTVVRALPNQPSRQRPIDVPTSKSDLGISSVDVSSSQVTLGCVNFVCLDLFIILVYI